MAAEKRGQTKQGRGHPKGGSAEKTAAQKEAEIMKSSKYPLLMNPEHLGESYQAKLQEVLLYDTLLLPHPLHREKNLIYGKVSMVRGSVMKF